MATKTPCYCKPWNAGLASETKAVERRLARLLRALKDEVNDQIVKPGEGTVADAVYNFRCTVIENLRASGWTVKANERGGYTVKAPR